MINIKDKNKDLRFLRTERALLHSIRSLLAEKNFNTIKIWDICVSASVSRAAFYQHYEDKYDLVIAWINKDLKPPAELFADDTLEEYYSLLLDKMLIYRKQALHLVKPDENKELLWRINLMWREGFSRYYEKKHQQGARFEVPYEIMAICICSGVISLIWWLIENDFCYPKETVVTFIVCLIRQSNAQFTFEK